MNPPIGVYQVGDFSPDGQFAAVRDPRIWEWLNSRGIDKGTVYRVNLFSLGAWVFRFAQDETGHHYKNLILDEPEQRLPLWVWQ